MASSMVMVVKGASSSYSRKKSSVSISVLTMSHHYVGYAEDVHEMEDVDNDMDDESQGRDFSGSESDLDEYDYMTYPGTLLDGFTKIQVSTLAVKDNLLVAGGFQGELICKHTSLCPNSKLLIIVGDDPDGMLVDSSSAKIIAHLRGHMDHSFASAWHPDGVTFATGNQDKTCRIWDTRNLSRSITTLKGNLGAIRSIRYTFDGRFTAMVEAADFVHVFDTKSGYEDEQEIDFFGEISGMSFSPDTESFSLEYGIKCLAASSNMVRVEITCTSMPLSSSVL